MADRYRRESRDSRDYRDGYSSRSHIGGHSQFSYSGQRRSPSPGVSHQSRRQSPPRTSAPPSIHSMIAHSSTSITLDERFTSLKRARSPSPVPSRNSSMATGSAKSRQYLDELAHRSDVIDKIDHEHARARTRSPITPSRMRPSSNGNHAARGDESNSMSRTERLEATKRIAASRSRGTVHDRLGINRTVGGGNGRPLMSGRVGQRPGGGGNGGQAAGGFKKVKPQQEPRQQKNTSSAADLDDELDAYMKQRA